MTFHQNDFLDYILPVCERFNLKGKILKCIQNSSDNTYCLTRQIPNKQSIVFWALWDGFYTVHGAVPKYKPLVTMYDTRVQSSTGTDTPRALLVPILVIGKELAVSRKSQHQIGGT